MLMPASNHTIRHLQVIPIDDAGQLHEAFNIRLEELSVIDIKFLYGTRQPTVAVLYQDTKEARHFKTYVVLLKEKVCHRHGDSLRLTGVLVWHPCESAECVFVCCCTQAGPALRLLRCRDCVFRTDPAGPLRCVDGEKLHMQDFAEGPLAQQNLDAGANMLIPVPSPLGGVVVIGESVIAYFAEGQAMKVTPIKQTIIRVRSPQHRHFPSILTHHSCCNIAGSRLAACSAGVATFRYPLEESSGAAECCGYLCKLDGVILASGVRRG